MPPKLDDTQPTDAGWIDLIREENLEPVANYQPSASRDEETTLTQEENPEPVDDYQPTTSGDEETTISEFIMVHLDEYVGSKLSCVYSVRKAIT